MAATHVVEGTACPTVLNTKVGAREILIEMKNDD